MCSVGGGAGSVEDFQQIHIAGGKFKGPEIMESSQEIHRARGYFRGPGIVAHWQLIYGASGIDLQQLSDILHVFTSSLYAFM